MSVKIKQNGALATGGNNIGPNYIMNGLLADALHNWGSWGDATDRSVIEKNGLHWLHHKSTDGTTTYNYGGFYQNNYWTNGGAENSDIPIAPNTYYTISGLWFASVTTKCRYWLHMRSSEGGANLKQFTKDFNVGTEPEWFYFTFNSGSDNTYTIDRFSLMLGSIANTTVNDVYCTYIKLEEGQIATPYIPCVSDIYFADKKESIIEFNYPPYIGFGRDYIVGKTFYEF